LATRTYENGSPSASVSNRICCRTLSLRLGQVAEPVLKQTASTAAANGSSPRVSTSTSRWSAVATVVHSILSWDTWTSTSVTAATPRSDEARTVGTWSAGLKPVCSTRKIDPTPPCSWSWRSSPAA